jgi:hypothetical protein
MPKGPKGEKRKADVIGNARPPVRLGSASKFKRGGPVACSRGITSRTLRPADD